MTLGERIRARRRELNLTQDDVAVGAGVGKSHICEIEKGKRRPSIEALNNIATVLMVLPGYLFGEGELTSDEFCKMYMKLPRNKKDQVRRVVREMLR